ncbi:MAG: hypothetical protein LBJ01_03545 [Tannerella sp.]|nr:hypothetical protein [Tannerella sp.]
MKRDGFAAERDGNRDSTGFPAAGIHEEGVARHRPAFGREMAGLYRHAGIAADRP